MNEIDVDQVIAAIRANAYPDSPGSDYYTGFDDGIEAAVKTIRSYTEEAGGEP